MCFFFKQSKDAVTVENRFNAKIVNRESFKAKERIIGFEFLKSELIVDKEPNLILRYNWGLIPHWAKDESIRKYTLNARIETLIQKPSFRDSANNRCLIIADGFYEWQRLDSKGKRKRQFLINLPDESLFVFAGIYSEWTNKRTGKTFNTFSIITTEANELMSEIHNSKKRMPVILTRENERAWLSGASIQDFRNINIRLQATEYKV